MPVPAPDPSKLPAGKPAYKLIELEQTIENAQVFHDAIDELERNNRFSQAVYVHNVDEYVNYDMYLTEDGKAGFAIEGGDNLVSVFSYAGKRAGHSLVQSAVDRGARRLDCYDIEHHLPKLYGAHGFKEIARAKFDRNEADPDWDYEHLHEPDVIAMAITKEQPAEVPYVKYPDALAMAKEASENL